MPSLNAIDALIPLALDEDQQRRSNPGVPLRAFGRMKPRATVAEAIAGLQPFFEASLQSAPAPFRKEIHLAVTPIRDRQVRDARLASLVLLGSVFAVLLVACTNVASLMLARATGRQRELAVRAALGASRARLFRQGLVESLTLGVLGGAAGCWIAHLLLKLFVSIAPEGIPRLQQASLDLRVVIFTFAIALISVALFGVAPALTNPKPRAALRQRGASHCARLFASSSSRGSGRGLADSSHFRGFAVAQFMESRTRPHRNVVRKRADRNGGA